jgi:cold shock CspA family protein
MKGTVVAFDAHAGLGEVRSTDGATLAFHCAEIADGTREIAVGAEVDFDVVVKLGRREAVDIHKPGSVGSNRLTTVDR